MRNNNYLSLTIFKVRLQRQRNFFYKKVFLTMKFYSKLIRYNTIK